MSGGSRGPKPDMREVDEVDLRRYTAQAVLYIGVTALHTDRQYSSYGRLTGGSLVIEPYTGSYDGSHSSANNYFWHMLSFCAQRRPTR